MDFVHVCFEFVLMKRALQIQFIIIIIIIIIIKSVVIVWYFKGDTSVDTGLIMAVSFYQFRYLKDHNNLTNMFSLWTQDMKLMTQCSRVQCD